MQLNSLPGILHFSTCGHTIYIVVLMQLSVPQWQISEYTFQICFTRLIRVKHAAESFAIVNALHIKQID